MKKLNITKERFNKSRYFQKKYGALKFMSESGNLYRTEKGMVLKFLKEDKAISPNFGDSSIDKVEPVGDVEQDFNNAMVALRDDNYEAFIADLNTLATDPKVEKLRDAIVEKFNSPDGVSVQFTKNVPLEIKNIHPTQFEVDMEKSLAYPLKKNPQGMEQAFSGKPVLINNTPLVVAEVNGTYYIIDGHHRWSQVYCLNPNALMTVRVIRSDMFKDADDVLKLVQMQLFIAKDGGKLPKATVDSEFNLYTIQENPFKDWVAKNISNEAVEILGGYVKKFNQAKQQEQQKPTQEARDRSNATVGQIANYLWNNVLTMRKEAKPTQNAHERGDMPQTDQVSGEYMKPKATPVSEKTEMKKLNVTKERFEKSRYFQKKYGKLEYVSESGKQFKTSKGIVLEFTDGSEGRSARELCASIGAPYHDDPLYGSQGYCGHEPDVDWEADREEYKKSQIKSGVILRRTNKVYDLWRIETVDAGMRLEENIHGLKKAEKLAKKNGWKVVKTIPASASVNESSFGDMGKQKFMRVLEDELGLTDEDEIEEWVDGIDENWDLANDLMMKLLDGQSLDRTEQIQVAYFLADQLQNHF